MEQGGLLELIAKYWVEQLCIVVLGIATWFYRKSLKKIQKDMQEQKAIRLAMVALLRDRFYQGYKACISQGYYPIQDQEVMRDIYQQYHALGGNGIITHLMDEQDELPTFPVS